MDHLVTITQRPTGESKSPFNDARFVRKNTEIKSDTSDQATDSQSDSNETRKSTYVDIPAPSARILFTTRGVFPFDLFPDELVVDEIKVSIVNNQFLTHRINSILIKDITDVLISSNPFFGSLLINGGEYQGLQASKENPKGPLVFRFLYPDDARRARRIIMGLMVFSDGKIDTSKMDPSEVIRKAEDFGKTRDIS